MSRAARLLDLIQIFRRSRQPVTAQHLAESLGVSERTVYRDILTLNAQGADIRGEAGLGYVLAAGFTLPPLMFTDDEIEAIILGLRWVGQRGDTELAVAPATPRPRSSTCCHRGCASAPTTTLCTPPRARR
jgi:predicted DNA-binding transcriptional regulator YafY